MKKLLNMMHELRQLCTWCQRQTSATITKHTIDEAYELRAAIADNNTQEIKQELADLLLQIIFYCEIASEKKQFDFNDIVETLVNKLKTRNPHIFGNQKITDINAIKQQWREIKTKPHLSQDSLISDISPHLPASVRSEKIQSRVAQVNFDWQNAEQVIQVLKNEITELETAITEKHSTSDIENELGDILFTCVNLARHLDTTVENALHLSNEKFIRRFTTVEKLIKNDKTLFNQLTFDEMLSYWESAKKELNRD